MDTYLTVKAWFAANWPADTAWPDGVDGVDIPPRLIDNPNPEGAAPAADAA